ncbi:aminoglycoside adenylyltransferase domain-containing protein [Paenibacillus sp. YAF4_2]|uniref:aminoglycoside adenylyltransferase domain-containing protein n=1 Tax=Paenibacillus sp. YAF4_2 TaxID=3233085 RepID=UPI003F9A3823
MAVPKKAQEVLDQHIIRLDQKLPNLVEAYHLFGSVSLGAFQEGFSDLDFVAVTSRAITEKEVQVIESIHRDLEQKFPMISLDGRYVVREDMENLAYKDCPYYYFNSGKLVGIERLHKNSIDAYQLKQYGIPILGKDPRTYDYTVDWDVLTQNMKRNVEQYWMNWKRKVERFPSKNYFGMLYKDWMIEWGVLGVSRIYYSIREQDMISKTGAGEYALQHVPARWHRIIQESIQLRIGSKKSLYRSRFQRRNDALAYMDYLMKECLRE